jgi:predicted membrane channel-forming protein YqfA (hemolysin III family)
VETLLDEVKSAGSYNVSWNATRYSSGVYFYKLETPDHFETKKMVLVK